MTGKLSPPIQKRKILMKHLVSTLCALFLFSPVLLTLVALTPIALAQEPDWNQFRGPNRDNHSFSTGVAKSWSEGGPRLIQKIDTLGNGFSNLAFVGDTIFTMGDFDNRAYVIALDRETKEIRWRTDIGRGGMISRFATPQSTPASDGEMVYAMGAHGDFVALDARSGEIRWRKDVRADLGGRFMGSWGFASSPLLDGDRIVIQVGGDDGVLIAFDRDGNTLWRTTNLPDAAAYTSVVPVTIEGVRQYLLLSNNYLVGINPTDGSILWGANFPGRSAVASDPVLSGDVIMASAAYNIGAYFYRISKEGETFRAFDFHGDDQPLQSQHGGIVAVGDYFYLLTHASLMVCVEAATGRVVWSDRSIGSRGSLTYVDGMLILRSERGDGTIALIEATPEGYRERGRFDQPYRSNMSSWTYPVVVNNRLYIRDQNVLLVFDLN